MLEVCMNVKGDIVLRESDEASGIGEIWSFDTIQNFVKDGVSVPRDVLPYLSRLSIAELKEKSEFPLKNGEDDKLEKDLTKLLQRMYYSSEVREFDVELVDGYYKFYEGETFLKTMTVLRFEKDLMSQKTSEANTKEKQREEKVNSAKASLRYFLENKNLNKQELEFLSNKMVDLYEVWRVEEDKRLEKLEEIRKRRK